MDIKIGNDIRLNFDMSKFGATSISDISKITCLLVNISPKCSHEQFPSAGPTQYTIRDCGFPTYNVPVMYPHHHHSHMCPIGPKGCPEVRNCGFCVKDGWVDHHTYATTCMEEVQDGEVKAASFLFPGHAQKHKGEYVVILNVEVFEYDSQLTNTHSYSFNYGVRFSLCNHPQATSGDIVIRTYSDGPTPVETGWVKSIEEIEGTNYGILTDKLDRQWMLTKSTEDRYSDITVNFTYPKVAAEPVGGSVTIQPTLSYKQTKIDMTGDTTIITEGADVVYGFSATIPGVDVNTETGEVTCSVNNTGSERIICKMSVTVSMNGKETTSIYDVRQAEKSMTFYIGEAELTTNEATELTDTEILSSCNKVTQKSGQQTYVATKNTVLFVYDATKLKFEKLEYISGGITSKVDVQPVRANVHDGETENGLTYVFNRVPFVTVDDPLEYHYTFTKL